MAKFEQKVEELIAKHPHLSKEDAEKILKEKNARKKQKRQEKNDRIAAKKQQAEERRALKGSDS